MKVTNHYIIDCLLMAAVVILLAGLFICGVSMETMVVVVAAILAGYLLWHKMRDLHRNRTSRTRKDKNEK